MCRFCCPPFALRLPSAPLLLFAVCGKLFVLGGRGAVAVAVLLGGCAVVAGGRSCRVVAVGGRVFRSALFASAVWPAGVVVAGRSGPVAVAACCSGSWAAAVAAAVRVSFGVPAAVRGARVFVPVVVG